MHPQSKMRQESRLRKRKESKRKAGRTYGWGIGNLSPLRYKIPFVRNEFGVIDTPMYALIRVGTE